jgi:hypothetical protein
MIDAHFQDGVMSVQLYPLPIEMGNILSLERCDYAALCLPKMYHEQLLRRH